MIFDLLFCNPIVCLTVFLGCAPYVRCGLIPCCQRFAFFGLVSAALTSCPFSGFFYSGNPQKVYAVKIHPLLSIFLLLLQLSS